MVILWYTKTSTFKKLFTYYDVDWTEIWRGEVIINQLKIAQQNAMLHGPVTDEKNFTITAQNLTNTVFLFIFLNKIYSYAPSTHGM